MRDHWRRREFLIALGGVPGLLGLGGCGPDEPRGRAHSDWRIAGYPTSIEELRPLHHELRGRMQRPPDNHADVALALLGLMADRECASFPVSLQFHSLQAATRAWHDDPKDEEAVVAALCHDVGTLLGQPHEIASGMLLAGRVREELVQVVSHHPAFQRRFKTHTPHERERSRDHLEYRDEPWFELALSFTERWDQCSFDPHYETFPLRHFEPMVRRVL